MRDFHLRFAAKAAGWPEGPFNFLVEENAVAEVPGEEGAYIFGTSDGTTFAYPWGASPIFYIGRADNLRRRLRGHRKVFLDAIEDHQVRPWRPRYQYGAAFGVHCAYFPLWDGVDDHFEAEAKLIALFYWAFGSIPVGNGAWPSGLG